MLVRSIFKILSILFTCPYLLPPCGCVRFALLDYQSKRLRPQCNQPLNNGIFPLLSDLKVRVSYKNSDFSGSGWFWLVSRWVSKVGRSAVCALLMQQRQRTPHETTQLCRWCSAVERKKENKTIKRMKFNVFLYPEIKIKIKQKIYHIRDRK